MFADTSEYNKQSPRLLLCNIICFHMQIALLFILVISIITSVLFALDKYRAVHDLWRIPESVLLFFSASGGAVGGIVAMSICRHKTQKPAFYRGLPAMLVAQMIILIITANIFLY